MMSETGSINIPFIEKAPGAHRGMHEHNKMDFPFSHSDVRLQFAIKLFFFFLSTRTSQPQSAATALSFSHISLSSDLAIGSIN